MKIGFIGLGKMGMNMVQRLLQHNHSIVAFDIDQVARTSASQYGAEVVSSIKEICTALPSPKVVWLMVPSGEITETTIDSITPLLSPGDILIDGGNSNYKDSSHRAKQLKSAGIHFLDIGTSGGIWGLKEGYCLMVGGDKKSFTFIEPILQSLAPPDGYIHAGESGSGHFVKMVHNGIEYAMLQAYAEGFELLNAKKDFQLDLPNIAKIWNNGSVIRSWLLELAQAALSEDPSLKTIKGYVADSGEGRWTVETAIDLSVPVHTIAAALFERFGSRQDDSYGNKFIAALRNQFGGHSVLKK